MQEVKFQPFSTSSGTYNLFNIGYYFCHKFNKQPYVYKPVRVIYKDDCIKKLSKDFKLIYEVVVPTKRGKNIQETTTSLAFEGDGVVIFIERAKLDVNDATEIDLEYDYDSATTRDINAHSVSLILLVDNKEKFNIIEKYFTIHEEDPINSIYLIVGVPGEGYALKEFTTKLPCKEMDLELNYGESFLKKHKTIVKRLNTHNDTGLVILNGKPGTGKTTYIKYLTTLLKKKIIFVPPNMTEGITAPVFLPFLLENKNSILVIEDAEKVIGSRESNDTNNGVSNILNMTDGILGDCLNIQIIATLNTSREKLDQALLRKGRLIAEHEFKELSQEESDKVFERLGIKKKADKPMTLTEIYNHDEEDFAEKEQFKKFIGFK
jgi:hypothetical protein